MFEFIKQMLIGLLSSCKIESFGESLAFNSKEPTKCASLNNQPCKARARLVNINSNQLLFLSIYC